jgi:hypothetical protein
MIPLGTGLFKTMYDTNMHNRIINKRNEEKMSKEINNKNNSDINYKDLEKHKIGYGDNQNIIEVKLKNSNVGIDNEEILSKLSFNLVDLIQ